MPAPRPSITPSVGAKLGNSAKRVPKESSSIPPASAMPALTSVSSMAAADRNTSVSTMIATAMPISSPTGAVGLLGHVDDLAVALGLDAGALGDGGRVREPLARRRLQLRRGPVVLDLVNAIRPSADTWPSARSGSAAPVTCGWPEIAATASPIAAARSGSRSVPSRTENTTVAVSPDCAGKRSASRSYACWDSVPGVVKSSEKPPPSEASSASAASTATTRARERFQ